MTVESSIAVELLPKKRRGRPAGLGRVPKTAPRPVSEIWWSVTDEEREKARKVAADILAYWRGLLGSRQVADSLGVKQNRVYQLQKRALAGMVVGLIELPRPNEPAGTKRPKGEVTEDLVHEVERLRKERENLLGLVRLLRTTPFVLQRRSNGEGKEAASGGPGTGVRRGVDAPRGTGAKGTARIGGKSRRPRADAGQLAKESASS